jgi:hypothetical protein
LRLSAAAAVQVAQLSDATGFGHAIDFRTLCGEDGAEAAGAVSQFFQSILPEARTAAESTQDASHLFGSARTVPRILRIDLAQVGKTVHGVKRDMCGTYCRQGLDDEPVEFE